MSNTEKVDGTAILIAAELRKRREARGWTQLGLVERLPSPLPRVTYASYENGARTLPLARLVEICAAMGVQAGDVIEAALADMKGLRERTEVPGGDEWHEPLWGDAVRIRVNWLRGNGIEPAAIALPMPAEPLFTLFHGVPVQYETPASRVRIVIDVCDADEPGEEYA